MLHQALEVRCRVGAEHIRAGEVGAGAGDWHGTSIAALLPESDDSSNRNAWRYISPMKIARHNPLFAFVYLRY